MNAEQIKTVVMLWNFFKSIDLEIGAELWLEFTMSVGDVVNRIRIIKAVDYIISEKRYEDNYTMEVCGFGMTLENIHLGHDSCLEEDGDGIKIYMDDSRYARMSKLHIESIESISITHFNQESEFVSSTRTAF